MNAGFLLVSIHLTFRIWKSVQYFNTPNICVFLFLLVTFSNKKSYNSTFFFDRTVLSATHGTLSEETELFYL